MFQELIQNAEDAKATRVCFLLDETQHGTDPNKLAHRDLSVHQVLLANNIYSVGLVSHDALN